jgi:DHA1 family bicyclomycin/chloramphenicol resistance-like MFS transporter
MSLLSQRLLPSPKKAKPDSHWIGILGFMCALPATATDLYLSSLPTITDDLHTTDLLAEFTLAGALIGAACGQLIVGPLSDKFGRKRPVFVGITIHILMSILCACAGNIYVLIGFRFIQGMANASTNVTALSMVRDLFTGSWASRMLSKLILIYGLAPLLAPSIGALLLEWFSWRAIFVVLALLGFSLLLVVIFFVPETKPPHMRVNIKLSTLAETYKEVFKEKTFIAFALIQGFANVTFFSWVMSASFILQDQWKLSPTEFALSFGIMGIGMILGAQLNSHLVMKINPKGVLRIFFPIQWTIILSMFLISHFFNIETMNLIPLWFVIFSTNPIGANATTLALENQGKLTGTASSIVGMCQTCVPALISPIVATLGNTFQAMSQVQLITISVSITICILFTPVFRKSEKIQ